MTELMGSTLPVRVDTFATGNRSDPDSPEQRVSKEQCAHVPEQDDLKEEADTGSFHAAIPEAIRRVPVSARDEVPVESVGAMWERSRRLDI